jgi:signal transduction histidine kinase
METRPYDRIAAELAALRRVAAAVARGALPEQVFAAVAAEAGLLLGTDLTTVARYDPGGVVVILGAWSSEGAAKLRSAGTRTVLAGHNMSALVFQTGRAVRIDDYDQATGEAADLGRELGFRRAVGVPITVEGQLWGVMTVASTGEEPLSADTEVRLAGFTELAGSAIANAQARVELRGYAEEQAALRRVAMLVARGAAPEEVFAAVAAEAGRLPGTDLTTVSRYDPDGLATVLSAWSSTGAVIPLLSAGTRITLGGKNVGTLVFQTRKPVRIDDYGWNATGAAAFIGHAWGYRAAAGAPITVEGQLWGVMTVASTGDEPLPADTEAQLAAFTELAGTAIANAEARAALAASRARIVTAADEARRRIERDLHDGAQQRLVTLAMEVQELQDALPSRTAELASRLAGVSAGLEAALAELREIARGIHPASLAQGGLRPALRGLVRRCPVPVDLHIQVADRPPQSVEIAAYYVVCEALANTAKHADASTAEVEVVAGDGVLRVRVHDDGRGGADLGRGSGLIGLRDRAEALGGRISLHSPPGMGTTLEVDIPLDRSNALPGNPLPRRGPTTAGLIGNGGDSRGSRRDRPGDRGTAPCHPP